MYIKSPPAGQGTISNCPLFSESAFFGACILNVQLADDAIIFDDKGDDYNAAAADDDDDDVDGDDGGGCGCSGCNHDNGA